MQTVHTDLKSAIRQAFAQGSPERIIPWNEIKRRSETETFFDLRQWITFLKTLGFFHIVGQDQSEFLPIRPTGPSLRRFAGIMIDRPDFRTQRSFPIDIISPQLNLQPPGDGGT